MRRPKVGEAGVGALLCSKPRPETHTRGLGGGRTPLAADGREGGDPESAAGETFPVFHSCQTMVVPLVPALIDTLEILF